MNRETQTQDNPQEQRENTCPLDCFLPCGPECPYFIDPLEAETTWPRSLEDHEAEFNA